MVSMAATMNRGSHDAGPRVGVSVIVMVLPAGAGSTWISTRATPVGRNRTSSTNRRGGSRSSTFDESCSSTPAAPIA